MVLENEEPVLQHIYPNTSINLVLGYLSHRKGIVRNKQKVFKIIKKI